MHCDPKQCTAERIGSIKLGLMRHHMLNQTELNLRFEIYSDQIQSNKCIVWYDSMISNALLMSWYRGKCYWLTVTFTDSWLLLSTSCFINRLHQCECELLFLQWQHVKQLEARSIYVKSSNVFNNFSASSINGSKTYGTGRSPFREMMVCKKVHACSLIFCDWTSTGTQWLWIQLGGLLVEWK